MTVEFKRVQGRSRIEDELLRTGDKGGDGAGGEVRLGEVGDVERSEAGWIRIFVWEEVV